MREVWFISVNVFRQLLRNRILAVLTLFALSLVGVVAFLGDLGQEAEKRLGQDFGLLALEWVGFFTVLLCHVVLLFEETELKTVNILLVKPVERWQYLLGKVAGSFWLQVMNQAAMTVTLLGLSWWRGVMLVDGNFLVAALYLALAGLLLSSITALFSVLASSVPAMAIFASFAFCMGHFTTNLLDWVKRLDSEGLKWLANVLFWLVPNFSLYNIKENLAQVGSTLSFSGVFLWPVGYGLCYGGVVLLLAVWAYEHKEF